MTNGISALSHDEIEEISGGGQFGTAAAAVALAAAVTGNPGLGILAAGLWLAGELSGQ